MADKPRSKSNLKQWADMGGDILSLDIRGPLKLYLLTLVHHQNPTTGLCCPGTKLLARELSTSARQVRRLRAELVKLGLLDCVGVAGKETKTGEKVWTYALYIPKAGGVTQSAQGGSESPSEGVTQSAQGGHTVRPGGSHSPHNVPKGTYPKEERSKEQHAATPLVNSFSILQGQDLDNRAEPERVDYSWLEGLHATPEEYDGKGSVRIAFRDDDGFIQKETIPVQAWEEYKRPTRSQPGRVSADSGY